MDTAGVRVPECLVAAVDVGELGARQARDDRPVHGPGNRLNGVEVTLARDREACLDVVDSEPGELLGDLELLARVERDPGDCSPSRVSCRR